MAEAFTIRVNGSDVTVRARPDTPLLYILRNDLELNGPKYGCGLAECGACAVLADGKPVRSCTVPLAAVGRSEIVTLEGLGTPEAPHPVQQAWIKHDVPQCGFCQSGMIMATAALLQANPKPTEADIAAEITNICRCGTYARVKTAILDVVAGGTLGRG